MPISFSKAVLNTILYADIFDYPLKLEGIGKWLIQFKSHPAVAGSNLKSTTQNSKLIEKKDEYYYVRGREHIVRIRKARERYSIDKLRIAKNITSKIKYIPTVKLVGLTGNLAINNADEKDDIDLLIITESGLLWTTRLLVTLLVEVFGRRRRPCDSDVTDKICLNMFVSEDSLVVPVNERDLFSAHEVAQMKPLFDRDLTYQKFLLANKWAEKYLPNAVRNKNNELRIMDHELKNKNKNTSMLNYSIAKLLNYLEAFLKKLQIWYMKKRMTKEVVRNGIIRFHPQDIRERVLGEYRNRLKIYNDTQLLSS